MNPIVHSQDKKGLYVILLILVVFLTFLPSLFNDYVNWDDGPHFLDNVCVHQPLSATSMKCAFGQFVNDSYIPLTTVSFILERHYFGIHPLISHAINLILHMCVVILVFAILLSLGCSSVISFIAALIFGIHPMRVESVVWITERKDVLYAVFYLAAVFVHLLFVRANVHFVDKARRFKVWLYFGLVLMLAGFSILAKPMALTLPFMLLLMDWFLKRKWNAYVLLEKCLVGAVVWPVAWWTFQTHVGKAMSVSLWQKALIILWSATFYIRKMLFPKLLVAVYDFPSPVTIASPEYQIAVAVLIMVLLFMYIFRKNRLIVCGMGFYICSSFYLWGIGTTIGKAHMVADRFMYVSSVGIALIVAVVWGLFFDRMKSGKMGKCVYLGISLAVISLLILKTISQSFIWKNGITLWAHQYRYQPEREKEQVVSGVMYAIVDHMERDSFLKEKNASVRQISEQAIQRMYPLDEDLSINFRVKTLNSMARFNFLLDKKDLALKYWKEAVELDPNYYWTFYRMAFMAMDQGQYDSAVRLLEVAAQRAPVEDRAFQQKVLEAMAGIAAQPKAGKQVRDAYNYMKNMNLQWYGP